MTEITGQLVCSERLLEALFEPQSRPTVRWLRAQMRGGVVPYVQIGRSIFFDVEMVRGALSQKNLVRCRSMQKVKETVISHG